MKKGKGLKGLIIGLIALCSTMFAASSVLMVATTATLLVDTSTYYTITYQGHKFKCYVVSDSENQEAHKAAIAWFWPSEGETANPIPDDLEIPETVTLGNVQHDVASIMPGGFRDCTFSTITLPKSIEEIGSEAFAYCTNLTSFSIPYQVTKIAPSTFMDCKNLEIFYYTDLVEDEDTHEVSMVKKLGNSVITEIGDHAFDNCVKLKGLYFPSSLRVIGNSAFQRCELLQSLFFPSGNATNSNTITVGSYAFADCPILKTVYFEENMSYIGPYAFADCKEDLTFSYTGLSEPTGFAEHWRDKHITTSDSLVYDFLEYGQSKIHIDDNYPGLTYSFEVNDQFLDSAQNNRPTVKVIENSDEYVKITSFQEPFATLENYYDIDTKTLTIPNQIEGRKVKVIGPTAFAAAPLKHVVFNKDLVQIQTRAFYGCDDITSLNFQNCEQLKEISYEIFQSPCPELASTKVPDTYKNNQKYNDKLTSICLPTCLEYIGDSAFYNFTNLVGGISFKATKTSLNDPTAESHLKCIGDMAFAVHRSKQKTQNTLIDVVLPNSLNDAAYEEANYYHPYTPSWKTDLSDTLRKNRYAVGRFVFENQDILGTVTMEPATAAQKADNNFTTSFMTNAFVRCNNLRKFKSNENLYLIGSDSFKACPGLRECFLYSEKAQWQYQNNNGARFPWGIMDNSPLPGTNAVTTYDYGMFASGAADNGNVNKHNDAVIYVSGSIAPGWLDDVSKYRNGTYQWNRDQSETLKTGLEYNNGAGKISNQHQIPTFYNVVWEGNDTNLYYWKPGSSGGTFRSFNPNLDDDDASNDSIQAEYTLSAHDYETGYIAIAPVEKVSGTQKYSIAHYFTNGASGNYSSEIDLTTFATAPGNNSTIAANLIEIAASAFANEDGYNQGTYFILSTSIERIGERAFFRKKTENNIARIVTYKSGGNILIPTGQSKTYAQRKASFSNTADGYCLLPPNVNRIEANCFFNNGFNAIELGSQITYIGASAFATPNFTNRNTTFTLGTNTYFKSENNGLYFIQTDKPKMLVYQDGGTTTDTLTISAGTIAVGFRAAIKTNYKKVTIPNGLTTIYGSAFMSSLMEEIDGDLSTLKYICARVKSGDSEVYNYTGNLPFENYDVTPVTGYAANNTNYLDGAAANAFNSCSNLKTVPFNQMTSIKVIGDNAFSKCGNLEYASSLSYNFYNYTNAGLSNSVTLETKDKGILDLQPCNSLVNINTNAFGDVKKITYTILPNTCGNDTTVASKITLANNNSVLPPQSLHLIGDTYQHAGILYKNDSLAPRTHYPSNALRGNDSYNYYYFPVDPADMPANHTLSDYIAATFDASVYNTIQYWTKYDGDYFLFKGKDQVEAFYAKVNAGTYTKGQALS